MDLYWQYAICAATVRNIVVVRSEDVETRSFFQVFITASIRLCPVRRARRRSESPSQEAPTLRAAHMGIIDRLTSAINKVLLVPVP